MHPRSKPARSGQSQPHHEELGISLCIPAKVYEEGRSGTHQTTDGISRRDLDKEEDGINHQQGDDPGLAIKLHVERFDLGRATT
jgi:hypothetical protein